MGDGEMFATFKMRNQVGTYVLDPNTDLWNDKSCKISPGSLGCWLHQGYISSQKLLVTGGQNNKCSARDQASNTVLRKLLCVKYLRRHVIDNHSRDFQTSNCATVSVKLGRATRSKRQLLNFLKANGKSELPSSSLTSGAVLPQRKGKCRQAN